MKIETNIGKKNEFFHDPIKYTPIERQIYDFFVVHFTSAKRKIGYKLEAGYLSLTIDLHEVAIEIGEKAVKLIASNHYGSDEPHFNSDPLKVSLAYNKDVTQTVEGFLGKLDKIRDLKIQAHALLKSVPPVKKVLAFLKQELEGDGLTVSCWTPTNEIDSVEYTFYIHPEGRPPADGAIFCFEHDTHKITPFWNRSTERRTKYGGVDSLENAAGKCGSDVDEMRRHIQVIDNLKRRIEAFDPIKSKDLTKTLEVKAQLRDVHQQFLKLQKGKS